MNLQNLAFWSLQIAGVVMAAALFPALARLRAPHARLMYWQAVLGACVLLPVLQRWEHHTVVMTQAPVVSTATAITKTGTHASFDWLGLIAPVLIAGALVRLGLIGAGFLRLARYRRHSTPLDPPSSWGTEAELLVSEEIGGPVTFGFRNAVVLLPANFAGMDEAARDAVLCHEILHVRRRDWLFTIAEELVRAALWFHPAIWWTLSEIQLAREQAVDREAIDMIKARNTYVDVLLSMAGASLPRANMGVDAAPAFLRKRHLKQRMVLILKESSMSRRRMVSTVAAGLAMVAGACWFVTSALPLQGAPQTISDSRGVSVDLSGVPLLHRAGVNYPESAISKGIEGAVSVLVRTDADGNVIDANIASGPDELRKAVLQSVLAWHFGKSAASSTRQISITFVLPKNGGTATVTATAPEIGAAPLPQPGPLAAIRPLVAQQRVTPAPDAANSTSINVRGSGELGKVISIDTYGLPESSQSDLIRSLPIHVGDVLRFQDMAETSNAVHAFDEHLTLSFRHPSPSEIAVVIGAPGNTPPPPPPPTGMPALPPSQIRVGANVESANLLKQVQPVYPPLAKAARVQGTVVFDAVIAKDGTVSNLTVVSGPPLLQVAAMQAARQWQYKPTLLNGQPVEVRTTISMNFALDQ